MKRKILIVGGVAGGATAAARLRRLDEDADIILFERGEYISFANCGLPYYIGDTITDRSKLTLQTPESFRARFRVDVRAGHEVAQINREAKSVTVRRVKDGTLYEETYDALVLSPGAEPVLPPIEGVRENGVFVLRSIPDTDRIRAFAHKPGVRRAVVVGGGYIGIEMAENLHALGMSVSIVELMDHVVQPLDSDMAGELHAHLVDKGVGLFLKCGVTGIHRTDEGLEVSTSVGGPLMADLVVMAVGVRPEGSLAKEAGLTMGARGAIATDEHMLTSDPSIYAVGDAVEVTDSVLGRKTFVPLASPANRQGRIAADNLCGIPSVYRGTQGTAILKAFDMTIAVTGANERTLKEAGIDYGRSYTFSASHATYYPGAAFMTVKLLYRKADGALLGAQLTGFEGVDKRCDVLATAIRFGGTIQDLTDLELSYAPPFGSAKDPVNMAGYVATNVRNGTDRLFFWDDVAALDLSKVTLLDVRTREEFQNGSIPGAVNIPLDDLRSRLSEIDAGKPVYEFCQIGLRGHIAYRILAQSGFGEVYNLAGGYRFYHAATRPFPLTPPVSIHGKEVPAAAAIQTEVHSNELSERSGELPPALRVVHRIAVDACGLQCPGPILKLSEAVKAAGIGDIVDLTANDPAFAGDVDSWARRTGNRLVDKSFDRGIIRVSVQKEPRPVEDPSALAGPVRNDKNIIVFSSDLDKALAAFIIATGAASMGRKVHMFFTFWGLNVLRQNRHIKTKKNLVSRMFGFMMPRGSKRLPLSQMDMLGIGSKMIRGIMASKNIDSLETLIQVALDSGIELVACTMTMDVMGLQQAELLDGVTIGGVARMLDAAEDSDASLFI